MLATAFTISDANFSFSLCIRRRLSQKLSSAVKCCLICEDLDREPRKLWLSSRESRWSRKNISNCCGLDFRSIDFFPGITEQVNVRIECFRYFKCHNSTKHNLECCFMVVCFTQTRCLFDMNSFHSEYDFLFFPFDMRRFDARPGGNN